MTEPFTLSLTHTRPCRISRIRNAARHIIFGDKRRTDFSYRYSNYTVFISVIIQNKQHHMHRIWTERMPIATTSDDNVFYLLFCKLCNNGFVFAQPEPAETRDNI